MGITKNIFKQAHTVFPSEKSVHGYFFMERAYIFFASKKNIGSLRKNPFSHAFRHVYSVQNSAKPVFLVIDSYAHPSIID